MYTYLRHEYRKNTYKTHHFPKNTSFLQNPQPKTHQIQTTMQKIEDKTRCLRGIRLSTVYNKATEG